MMTAENNAWNPLKRIKHLQRVLSENLAHAALIHYSRSLLYYTGTTQPSVLIVTPQDYCLLIFRGFEPAGEEVGMPLDRMSRSDGYEDVKKRLEEMHFLLQTSLRLDWRPAF